MRPNLRSGAADDAALSRFDPLPRIICLDDFDRGFCGWTQLVGNYEEDLDAEEQPEEDAEYEEPEEEGDEYEEEEPEEAYEEEEPPEEEEDEEEPEERPRKRRRAS